MDPSQKLPQGPILVTPSESPFVYALVLIALPLAYYTVTAIRRHGSPSHNVAMIGWSLLPLFLGGLGTLVGISNGAAVMTRSMEPTIQDFSGLLYCAVRPAMFGFAIGGMLLVLNVIALGRNLAPVVDYVEGEENSAQTPLVEKRP